MKEASLDLPFIEIRLSTQEIFHLQYFLKVVAGMEDVSWTEAVFGARVKETKHRNDIWDNGGNAVIMFLKSKSSKKFIQKITLNLKGLRIKFMPDRTSD
jgi:hypothetical protein